MVLAGQELGRLIVYRGLVSDHEKYGLMMTGDTSTAEGPSLDPCLYSLAFCLAVHIFYKQGNKFNRPSDPSFFFFLFFAFGVCSCIRSCAQMDKFSFAYLMAVQPPKIHTAH